MHRQPRLGCPSHPHGHLCVAFFPLRLRGPRILPLPRGYPREVRTLGEHIRRRRLDLGLGQRHLAARLGIREETLASWERDQAEPMPRHYGAIVRFLGYDPRPAGKDLPGRLNAIRRRLGLTQRELADRLGLDEGTVTDFELGRRRVTRKVGEAIERLLRAEGAII